MSSRPAKNKSLSFEQATARLEEIVARLDNPQTGLEETIALVAEGYELKRSCKRMLAEAELKIKQLETRQEDEPEAKSQAEAPAAARRDLASQDDDHGFRLF